MAFNLVMMSRVNRIWSRVPSFQDFLVARPYLIEAIHRSVQSMKIFSLDPGPRNCGWVSASFEPESGVLVLEGSGVVAVINQENEMESMARGLWELRNEELRDILDKADRILVEYQFPDYDKPLVFTSVKNTVIEIAFKAMFHPDRVTTIYPSPVKKHYRMTGGSNQINKYLVVNWARNRLGTPLFTYLTHKLPAHQKNHVCDALLNLFYWVEVSNRWPINSIKIINEDVHAFREGEPQLHPGHEGPSLEGHPPTDRDGENQGDGCDQPETTRERTLSFFFPHRSGHQGSKRRRPSTGQPQAQLQG